VKRLKLKKLKVVSNANGGRIIASPLAKKIAKEKGIDLAQVAGSAMVEESLKKISRTLSLQRTG
jgi:pyruvate dehydrogenase E2 component (dihydrolipoamide acetyltransferase)